MNLKVDLRFPDDRLVICFSLFKQQPKVIFPNFYFLRQTGVEYLELRMIPCHSRGTDIQVLVDRESPHLVFQTVSQLLPSLIKIQGWVSLTFPVQTMTGKNKYLEVPYQIGLRVILVEFIIEHGPVGFRLDPLSSFSQHYRLHLILLGRKASGELYCIRTCLHAFSCS